MNEHRNQAVTWTIAGLLLAVIALLIEWQSAPQFFPGFPPGVVYVAGAAVIVLLDRRSPWSPASAILLSAFITIGGTAGGDMTRDLAAGNTGLTIGVWLMNAGLGLAVVAGIVAIVIGRRRASDRQPAPYSKDNPHRTTTLIAAGALFLSAIADAAPEGLHWDGPGPVMFLVLGLLVLFVPGRHILMLSALLSAAFVYGAFDNMATDHLTTPSDTVPFIFANLQLVGYTVATVAGGLAALPVKAAESRQYSPSRPGLPR
ncbi:MAG TPA: hypothetical protein VHZ97_13020 [Pseudonocardiaceae bacterium]|jgi:hypothetical protein|nr:hypothetical protein [Pseudonocardiaceae bacterium]